MDKNRVKGKLDDAAGRVKRQVGEWTGDSELQAEGTTQQVKGKVENAWGKAKDAVRDLGDEAKRKTQDVRTRNETRNEMEREQRRDIEDEQRKKDVA
jgi:uncharacterized protein YjbJ (UPF0337 family)